MNRRLLFDFQKKSRNTKCKDCFSLHEPVLNVLHTKLLPEYFEDECRFLAPNTCSTPVQHFLVKKSGRDAHIDEKAASAIPVGLKM